jgi:4-carboxymuconolactone decarboxylase
VDIGSAVGREQGIPVEKLQALGDPASASALDETEKLVLAYAEAMSRTPVDVPEELWQALRARFSESQIVELTHSIAWENFRARFNRALLVESDNLSEASFCIIPARPQLAKREP